MKKLRVHHIHDVPGCWSSHKAILVMMMSGRKHYFHDYIFVMPLLLLQYLSSLCVIYINTSLNFFSLTCLILKRFYRYIHALQHIYYIYTHTYIYIYIYIYIKHNLCNFKKEVFFKSNPHKN